MHEVLVNRLGGLSLPRKSVVRLTDRPDMTLDVYRGRKSTTQHTTMRRRGTKQFIRLFCKLEKCITYLSVRHVFRKTMMTRHILIPVRIFFSLTKQGVRDACFKIPSENPVIETIWF